MAFQKCIPKLKHSFKGNSPLVSVNLQVLVELNIEIGMNFCSHCGSKVDHKVPEDDNRLRYICISCDTIHYQNPNIVAGTVSVYGEKILLCKRAIEPRKGFWTLPAGFMENQESTNDAALRESCCSDLKLLGIAVDADKNQQADVEVRSIEEEAMPVKILVIATNEELEIALQAKACVHE